MSVVSAVAPQATPIPGVAHRTVACAGQGLESLSVWDQVLEPGAMTPPHRHTCDEVVLVLAGGGTLLIDGESRDFARGDTLVLPANRDHQILNTGLVPLRLFAAFSASPVATFLPDGTGLDLPWRS